MDRSEIEQLVQRLVENPHDEEALQYAHQAGEEDPKAYAQLLEKVAGDTKDPAYAAHWLSEAANVWSSALGDAHRAARLLMMAIDKDPTQPTAADRLAQLYRDKGDVKGLVALLDRRAKALTPIAATNDEVKNELAGMYEEMGRLWADAPLSQPKKAIECFRRAMELDPTSAYAIYNARELLKGSGQFRDAIPLYDAELSIEQDPGRRVGLFRDLAATCKSAGDLPAATRALAQARELEPADPGLQQEYASSVLDRVQAGEPVSKDERTHAADLLIALAEAYEGEHGYAYANAALDIDPGADRAIQLAAYYARALGQEGELPTRYAAYLTANPNGGMAAEVRHSLAAAYEADGRVDDAVRVLDPLKNAGDPAASAKILELVPQAPSTASSLEQPRRESVPPPVEKRVSVPPAREPGGATGVTASAASQSVSEPARYASAGPRSEPPSTSSPDDIPQRRAPLTPDKIQGILDAAQMLAGKGKKPEALSKYKEILEADPAHPEALAWVEDYLRSKRDYPQLREVLTAAVRATPMQSADSKKERLREIAGLCEGQLRDPDAAIAAWKQLLALDRADESARTALTRLLEKAQRWDDLANLLEQEATVEADVEQKVALEKKLAKLQEDKRKDLIAAGDAWARIARLLPDDEFAVQNAAKLFERGERVDLAIQIIGEMAPGLEDPVAKGPLMQRLGELREQQGDFVGAGDSFAEAAESLKNGRLWEEAERLYVAAERWDKAANAATQRGQLTSDAKQQAQFYYRAADYLGKVGDADIALARLEDAANLDPVNDDYANAVVARYQAADHIEKLVHFLTRRGDRLMDKTKRVTIRREAATLSSSRLSDRELSRELWLKVLEDGDDKEALEKLIDDAVEREDHTEAATLLRRLAANTVDKAEKARVALREAELLADGVGDVDTAIARYEQILTDLDPTCRPALQAIADLQEARDCLAEAADALERELKLVADVQERGQIAARLARLYESLEDPRNAIRALDLVRKADLEDFDALTRLCELCEVTEQWGRVAELLVERIEVEADEAEISQLTMKLSRVLADKLDRGDEALAALTELADSGDAAVRAAYIDLGDRLGWKGIVASKLVDWWFEARHGAERTSALKNAFDRFVEVGRDQDAVRVAIELIRTKTADKKLADQLEELAVKTGDHDALTIAHDLLARDVTGADRAFELVRQAEVRSKSGMPRLDCLQHGEAGLTSIQPADAEPLLERLAALAPKPQDVVDLYERQVSRSKAPPDRMRALARAAQVAATRGQIDRTRGFFELALSGAPGDDTLNLLEQAARDGDRFAGGDRLRRALANAMSAGGHGARDGGRTRGALLRRAAQIAHRELNDIDQSFSWLGDALVANVDTLTLDALEGLGLEVGDPRRSEAALTHALNEVFDGPLVRQLLGRRAKIRRDQIVDHQGAAADLKKLHDLSPTDQAVLEELAGLLTELGDFKALVQIYEDQILRGKDIATRAELARKVARMWEEQLQDAREAADAWRRVLRMKAGDAEATEGLERAKTSSLKRADPASIREAYAPPKLPQPAPAAAAAAPAARGRGMASPPQDRPRSALPPTPPKVPSSPPAAPPPPAREPTPQSLTLPREEAPTTGVVESMPTAVLAPRVDPPAPPAPAESTGVTAVPRSVPPPIPASVPATQPPTGLAPAGPAPVTALEDEIDASLNRLELPGLDLGPLPAPSPASTSAEIPTGVHEPMRQRLVRDAADTLSTSRPPRTSPPSEPDALAGLPPLPTDAPSGRLEVSEDELLESTNTNTANTDI
ncbi:MAG: hypothetical protein JNL38_02525, partial [Myxococcales bacterium]|nr:hypothetical protein [Myxococcales bacterium]